MSLTSTSIDVGVRSNSNSIGAPHFELSGDATQASNGTRADHRATEQRASAELAAKLRLFLRQMLTIVGGASGSQLVLVAALPILSRAYSPASFGTFAVYLAVTEIFAAISTGRYEQAIPLPEKKSEAFALLGLSLRILFLYACLLVGVVALLIDTPPVIALFGGARSVLWLVPLGLIPAGVTQGLVSWCTRNKNFSGIAIIRITSSIGIVTAQLVFAFWSNSSVALIIGDFLGRCLAACYTVFRARRDLYIAIWLAKTPMLSRVMRKYSRYPIFSSWSALLNIASTQAPAILIATICGDAVTGAYVLCLRALLTPVSWVTQSVGLVLYGHGRHGVKSRELTFDVLRIWRLLSCLSATPFIALMFSAPVLFTLVFGNQWEFAGQIARWLLPWMLLVCLISPLSVQVHICGRQRGELCFQSVLFSGRLLAILLLSDSGEPLRGIAALGIVSAISWLGYGVWLIELSANRWFETFGGLLAELAWGGLFALPVAASLHFQLSVGWLAAAAVLTVIATALRFRIVLRNLR